MLNIGNVKVPVCDGVTRRSFLQAGLGRPGGPVAARRCCSSRRPAPSRTSQAKIKQLHHDLPRRLAGPPRHLGHEARRPGRGPRQVQADRHQRAGHPDLRALPAHGADDGQGGADPQPAPQHRRDARERPALDDDRPRLQRRQREAARRQRHLARLRPEGRAAGQRHPARPDRQHRRRPAARPDGRATSAAPTSRSSSTPTRPARTSRSPTWKCPPGSRQFRLDARRKLLDQLDELQRRTETRSTQMHDSAYERAFRLLTSPQGQGGVRPRPRSRTSSATATAATRSARAA